MGLFQWLLQNGVSPLVAALLVAVVVLWAVLVAGVTKGFRFLNRQAKEQRRRIDDCEADREDLREEVTQLKVGLARLESCPRANCPMRRHD